MKPPRPAGRPSSKLSGGAAALLQQAAALGRAGRHDEALAALERAAGADPKSAQAQHLLGLALAQAEREADAVARFERAAALDPQFAPAWLALGGVLQSLGREGQAAAVLLRAAEVLPRNAEIQQRLGDLLRARQNVAEAQASYRRGAAAARNTTLGRMCQAKLLAEEEKFAAAAEVMRRALALDPNNAAAAQLAAQMLSFHGALDEAARHFERALALDPDNPWEAWCGVSGSRRLGTGDRPLVARIEAAFATARLPLQRRMRVHFALGKAYDDLAEYATAMRHFDAANRIRRLRRPFDRRQFLAAIDSVIGCFTGQFFAARQGLGVADETPVLVLGMPRSGTTLVEQIISSHKQAAAAGEQPFWSQQTNGLGEAAVQALDGGKVRAIAAEYLAVLRRHGADAARITDKMPFNFHWIGLIRLIFPHARIVHCRRHPIDTCLSNYVTDFEMNWGFVSDRADLVFVYRHYRRLMAHWRAVLPQDRVLEIDYERLIGGFESETRALIGFLGLDWDEACLRPDRNRHAVRTASVWQARQPVYRSSLERWRRYQPWLGALAELEEG